MASVGLSRLPLRGQCSGVTQGPHSSRPGTGKVGFIHIQAPTGRTGCPTACYQLRSGPSALGFALSLPSSW